MAASANSGFVVKQPDIAYKPDYASYLARADRRTKTEDLQKTLPAGFPKQLDSPLVWDGQEIGQTFSWTYELDNDEVNEIDAGLRHFKELGLKPGHVSPDNFPLPTLHATLRDISKEIHLGHGFKVLRGIPVERYTREDNILIYLGVTSHVASVRGRQDHQYQGKPADVILSHIIDLTSTTDGAKIGTPAHTADKQVFHTDSGDIITLLALSAAAQGGESYLASTGYIYNKLARERPDLIQTLSEPWVADGFGPNQDEYVLRTLLQHNPATDNHPEQLTIQYARRYFTGFSGLPRSANIPPLTEAQAEALDTLHFLAEKHAVTLDFKRGDIQFANNLSLLHARGGFIDSPEQKRHLLRLWIRDPELAWKTPEALKERWESIYEGVDPESSIYPPEPHHRESNTGI